MYVICQRSSIKDYDSLENLALTRARIGIIVWMLYGPKSTEPIIFVV